MRYCLLLSVSRRNERDIKTEKNAFGILPVISKETIALWLSFWLSYGHFTIGKLSCTKKSILGNHLLKFAHEVPYLNMEFLSIVHTGSTVLKLSDNRGL